MNSIQRALLRAKHWEIFALWVTVAMFFMLAMNALQRNPLFSLRPKGDNLLFRFLKEGDWLVLYTWSYFVGSFLNSISPLRFRIRPAVFFLGLVGLLIIDLLPHSWWISPAPLIFTLFLVDLICLAYVIHFPSKTLVMAEAQESATFSEYTGPFFLVWFFPLGIWFLQPRINDLYAAHQSLAAPADPVPPATQVPA